MIINQKKLSILLLNISLITCSYIYADDNSNPRIVCNSSFSCYKDGATRYKDTTSDKDSGIKYWVLTKEDVANGQCNGGIPVQEIVCPSGVFSIDICDCKTQ